MECGSSDEKSLATRKDDRRTGLSLERSLILVLYILQVCIRRRRLRFDEKLNVLRALAWIITHTEFEGLLQAQSEPPMLESIPLSDSNELTTYTRLLM